MATRTDHLVGLLLGAEEDWPTAFEALARRLGVLKPPGGGEHTITTERLTIARTATTTTRCDSSVVVTTTSFVLLS